MAAGPRIGDESSMAALGMMMVKMDGWMGGGGLRERRKKLLREKVTRGWLWLSAAK